MGRYDARSLRDRAGRARPPPRASVARISVLLLKLTLAPALVAATTLAARRFGPLVGGVVGGFPAVVGPILAALTVQHGDGFAAHAAGGALAGLISLSAFMVAYAHLARMFSWPATLVLSWVAFAGATALLDGLAPPPGVALPLVLASFAAAYALMPRTQSVERPATPSRWDMPMRLLATAAFVLALTGVAGALGPRLSGLLAAFPVLGSVLCAFIQAEDGPAAVADFLRGLTAGLSGFAAFCFVVAELQPPAGGPAAFTAGTVTALVVNGGLAVGALRRRRVTAG